MTAQATGETHSVDIGGRRLSYTIDGKPAGRIVVLDKGAAGGGVWGKVVEGVGDFATVITYDRAGVGRSDPPSRRPTADAICEDLHRLMEAAAFPRPAILVVWSLTGLSGLLHAQRYPGDFDGVVFIDPTPFDLFDHPANAGMLRYPKLTVTLQRAMARLGYGRSWGREPMAKFIREGCGPHIDEAALPKYIDSLFEIIREKATGELFYFRESCVLAQAEMAGARIPDVKAVVLSAAVDKVLSEASTRAKHANHRAYAALFDRGAYIRVEGGSHMMTLDRPDAIVEAVRHLVQGGSLPSGRAPA